ncbi:hypothetical protein BDW22DRAFT_431129 [Trametopsis cervina]|nr:hypothetical protein BDW22DRAFT_431129 [Trametopsis cervina]
METQAILSERLQLLHKIEYADPSPPYLERLKVLCKTEFIDRIDLLGKVEHTDTIVPDQEVAAHFRGIKHAQNELRLLDTLVALLATENPADVYAAALDRNNKVELVLAKNGQPTPADISYATKLLSTLANPATKQWDHIFPFLVARGCANINKRISALHSSISDPKLRDDLMEALKSYVPGSLNDEFPMRRSKLFRSVGFVEDHTADGHFLAGKYPVILQRLLEDVGQLTSTLINPAKPDARHYSRLTYGIEVLSFAKVFKTLTETENPTLRERTARLERLRRRLKKVEQYSMGVNGLILRFQRISSSGAGVAHRWITSAFVGAAEGVITLDDDVYAVIQGALSHELSPDDVSKLDQRFPSLVASWTQHTTVHASLHAEVRILLHFAPQNEVFGTILRPIGVSKRSCLCCTIWMDEYNSSFETSWMTSGSHRKPCASWALPGRACSECIGDENRSKINQAVVHGVLTRLQDQLSWLVPGSRQISDEHNSGEIESEKSGGDSGSGSQKEGSIHGCQEEEKR